MKEVTINGEVFNVRELTIGEMMPLWDLLTSNSQQGQIEMLKLAVHKDGQQMGDAVLNLGLSFFLPLLTAVMELNNMTPDEEGEGN